MTLSEIESRLQVVPVKVLPFSLVVKMSNLLFGSSNVYRNFERASAAGCFPGLNLQLVRCTKKAVLDSHLITLTSANLVVTSVLENFIAETCAGILDNEVQLFAHQQLTAHVEELHRLVTRFPTSNVVIMPPMYRADPGWFGSYLPSLHNFLSAEVARMGSSRMVVCTPFLVTPSMLEDDGVHLIPAAGDRFLSHLSSSLSALLVEVSIPQPALGEAVSSPSGDRLDQILSAVNRNSSQIETFGSLGQAVSTLSRTTTEFEVLVRRRFKDDNLIFARMKEESDAAVNRSREDRVVITGLPGPSTTTSTHAEKKKHYAETVTRLITLACVSVEPLPKVADVYINLRKDRGLPLVEVRLDSFSGAGLLRREGVRLAKAEHAEFSTLFFSNSVTQSTRVRIDILKVLAKKLTTVTETAFVQGFLSRPVLQYRVKEGARSAAEGTGRSYNFVDAIMKFGSRLAQKDLAVAYTRAGDTFAGALSQYFIVLSDEHAFRGVRSSANRAPLGQRGAHSGGVARSGFARNFLHPSLAPLAPVAPSDRGLKRPSESATETPSKRQENADESDILE